MALLAFASAKRDSSGYGDGMLPARPTAITWTSINLLPNVVLEINFTEILIKIQIVSLHLK